MPLRTPLSTMSATSQRSYVPRFVKGPEPLGSACLTVLGSSDKCLPSLFVEFPEASDAIIAFPEAMTSSSDRDASSSEYVDLFTWFPYERLRSPSSAFLKAFEWQICIDIGPEVYFCLTELFKGSVLALPASRKAATSSKSAVIHNFVIVVFCTQTSLEVNMPAIFPLFSFNILDVYILDLSNTIIHVLYNSQLPVVKLGFSVPRVLPTSSLRWKFLSTVLDPQFHSLVTLMSLLPNSWLQPSGNFAFLHFC